MRTFAKIRAAVEQAIKESNAIVEEKRTAMDEAVELAAAARAEADMAFDSDVSPLEAAALEITAKRNEKAAEHAKAEFEKAERVPAFDKRQYDAIMGEAVASRIEEAARIGDELRAAIDNVEAITDKLKHIDDELAELAGVMRRNSNMSKDEFDRALYNVYNLTTFGYYCSQTARNAVSDIRKMYESKIKPNLRA